MAINSRQDLFDYSLRQLGAPVINIEIDDAQAEDVIDTAVQFFTEYHYDGIVRDYLVQKITGTQITVSDASKYYVQDVIGSSDGHSTQALIMKIVGNVITINPQIGFTKFAVGDNIVSWNTMSSSTILAITLGDADNGYVIVGEDVVGVNKILNITSVLGSSDYLFNMQYQIMMTELQALTKAGASTYWQTMNYLGNLDFIMKKEKDFTFNRRMNRLFLEVAWGTDINVGDILVAEIYRFVDPEEFGQVYNDRWLKKYTTAQLKKMWGTNLKKYDNMILPGGLTYNGQKIFDEALVEIDKLETEMMGALAPLNFIMG